MRERNPRARRYQGRDKPPRADREACRYRFRERAFCGAAVGTESCGRSENPWRANALESQSPQWLPWARPDRREALIVGDDLVETMGVESEECGLPPHERAQTSASMPIEGGVA